MIDALEVRDDNEDQRAEPTEKLEKVELDNAQTNRMVSIGSSLGGSIREKLIDFLKQNEDIFAWSHADHLNADPSFRPVKQKPRVFGKERSDAMLEKVHKLIATNFVREVQYPDWFANVVLVKKSNGKWCLCIDFKDLNKACSRDSYPLPRIDQLVDSTSGHKLLSFMDAISGYNQILMNPANQEGATCQRLINHMFAHQIGRNMEVYVDDMLTKSKRASDHLVNLEETFQVLRKFNMKLNPAKCAFEVAAGKFLGFLVNHNGIEANPEKVRAILDMQPPTTIKEV